MQLLNDTTGKVDAKVACKKAVRLQRAYLIKVSPSNDAFHAVPVVTCNLFQ